MSKMEQIERMWQAYEKYKETAEQHEFVRLLMLDMKLEPYYNDLHNNYDEKHTDTFISVMAGLLESLGIEVDLEV